MNYFSLTFTNKEYEKKYRIENQYNFVLFIIVKIRILINNYSNFILTGLMHSGTLLLGLPCLSISIQQNSISINNNLDFNYIFTADIDFLILISNLG